MKNFLPDITQIPIRSPFLKRKKSCPLSGENAPKIDYKDTKLLKKYLSERGKIIPSRVTSVSAKKQRELFKGFVIGITGSNGKTTAKEKTQQSQSTSKRPTKKNNHFCRNIKINIISILCQLQSPEIQSHVRMQTLSN